MNNAVCFSVIGTQTKAPRSMQAAQPYTSRLRNWKRNIRKFIYSKEQISILARKFPWRLLKSVSGRLCFRGLFVLSITGSRGDVFVVRTSKPVENLWKNGLFWSRYSFVTHSIYRKPRDWGLARQYLAWVALRVTCCAPARLWLEVIDTTKSICVR